MPPLAVGDDVVLPADRLVVVVRAAHHRQHLAGGGIDDLSGTVVHVARAQVGAVHVVGDRLLRHLLQVVVNRRGHPEAATRHHRVAVLLAQLAEDVVDEPGGFEVFLDGAVQVLERLFDGLVVLGLADVVIPQHVGEHQGLAAPGAGGAGRTQRIELGGRIRNPGQHGGFRDIEILRRLGEIGLGRGLDSIGFVTVEDLVEIERQDVVLRESSLQLEGEHRLAHFSLDRGIVAHEHPLDELLGDGAAALGRPLVGDVREGGADDATEIEPVVGVEGAIFERDRGFDQVRRDGRERDHRADHAVCVLDVEQYAVAVVDLGGLGELFWVE